MSAQDEVTLNSSDQIVDDKAGEQKERARLRLTYLQLLHQLSGRAAEITTIEKNQVCCVYEAADRSFSQLAVSQLVTPLGRVPAALFRLSDTDHIRILPTSN